MDFSGSLPIALFHEVHDGVIIRGVEIGGSPGALDGAKVRVPPNFHVTSAVFKILTIAAGRDAELPSRMKFSQHPATNILLAGILIVLIMIFLRLPPPARDSADSNTPEARRSLNTDDSSIMDNARVNKARADVATLCSYIQIYITKHNGQPPPATVGLRALITQHVLSNEALLTDPWGEPVEYVVPARRSKDEFDVFSKGKDKIAGNEDDIGNWTGAGK